MSVRIEHIEHLEGLELKLLEYKQFSHHDSLLETFSEEERNRYLSFKTDKRRAEFYYTRILWSQFQCESAIFYDHLGRPFVEQGGISISHSRNVIAIMHSPGNLRVGVDIEFYNPKIAAIADKFLGDKERLMIQNEWELTLIWTIKEAVFKMMRTEGVSFKNDILVNFPDKQVSYRMNGIWNVTTFGYIQTEDYMLAFCSNSEGK